MRKFSARRSIDEGLYLLSQRLEPIIDSTLAPSLGGLPWPTVLSELDQMRGKPSRLYAAADLQAQLRVITERLGNLGFPFDNQTRLVSVLGSELRIMRNRWAHYDELTTIDAWRSHDFVVRLLEHFDDSDGVEQASVLREAALNVMAAEMGATVTEVVEASAELEPEPEAEKVARSVDSDEDAVRPDPTVLTREDGASTPTIGTGRSDFEPWTVVLVGDVSVLDDLPKKAAKEQVRAVATEIADFEGPIHIDRLVKLTAASFGLRSVFASRARKMTYQIKQTDLLLDAHKFVWPSDLDPDTWREFRPNDSDADRPFTEISPVEIANAMRFLKRKTPDLNMDDLEAATLRTFGRRRKTSTFAAHLKRATQFL